MRRFRIKIQRIMIQDRFLVQLNSYNNGRNQNCSVGKKIKCTKEKNNPYDAEAIKVVMKEIGTVGYVANAPYTVATGTMSAGRLYEKVKKKFVAEVMFITSSQIICRVVDGFKGQKEKETVEICLKKKPFDTNDTICRE